jgi:Phospholipase_D-nuclease N-terminal
MKAHRFLSVVPKPFHIVACAIVCSAVLIGVLVGFGPGPGRLPAPPELHRLGGLGIGLLAGSIAGIWVLCLGYVYADSRRRAMRPVLWTLIAALIPNLLGFLLYFALRQPILLPCPGCGRPIATEQRFCSWCGRERISPPSTQTLSQAPGAPS